MEDRLVEQRLVNLEVKASYMEDLVDKLNDVIVGQQRTLDLLVRELSQLKQQAASAEPAAFRSLRDELPPHY